MTAWHVDDSDIARYVAGDITLLDAVTWSIEAHLVACSACRGRVAALAPAQPALSSLLRDAEAGLATRLDQAPTARSARRHRPAWLPAGGAPAWALATVAVLLVAFIGDLLVPDGRTPLLLLVGPALPLLGVAVSWGAALDPTHELTSSTPRAGLGLLLRRTLVVLALALPLTLAAGLLTDLAAYRWLLPCLGLTAGALALGTVVDLAWASAAVAVGWTLGVVLPASVRDVDHSLLSSGHAPAWAAVAVVAAAVVALRRTSYTRLSPS